MSAAVDAAARIVADLVAAGVRDVVLSPGSRSAPIAYVVAAAERDGRLRLHVRHDERSAGFLGLGLGKADPRHPAAVVTTSGSAVANLVPAAMEAHHAGVPLLLLTADRPARLRSTWANQTSDLQPGVFGSIAWHADIDPATCTGAPWLDALAAARGDAGRRPGPAHLNVCFDAPLQPAPGAHLSLQSGQGVAPLPEPVPDEVVRLASGPRTVVVAGDGAGPAARVLAEQAGWPLLAEPTSGARGGTSRIDAYRLVLRDLAPQVERAVVFGRPTLSRPVTSLLDDPGVEIIQVVRHGAEPGPGRPVRRVAGVTAGLDDVAWRDIWRLAGAAALQRVTETIDAWPYPTGLQVARTVAAATRSSEALLVGSSNAVRDVDLLAGALPGDALILANRGLAGIDGAISTALGIALGSARPTRAYLGDLTFLHDLNGLAVPAQERDRVALQLVVANDDGGGIFATLEHARHPEVFERVFGTPTGADLRSLCQGYGISHQRVTLAELPSALPGILPGITVIEIATSRTDLGVLHSLF